MGGSRPQVLLQLRVAQLRMAERRVSVLKRQECAKTAWAFATASMSSEMLFAARARGAEVRSCGRANSKFRAAPTRHGR